MDNASWVGFVALVMVAMQLLGLYNTWHTASKNAHEPMARLENRVLEIEKKLTLMDNNMERIKTDVDHAHAKIRENEETMSKITKAQNKALLAILLWIKDPQHEDNRRIDDAINEMSIL